MEFVCACRACCFYVPRYVTCWHVAILHHTATHCATLCRIAEALLHSATHGNTLQHCATHFKRRDSSCVVMSPYCNRLPRTLTHCNTLQHTSSISYMICCNAAILQQTATHYTTLQHAATHCTIHCNPLHASRHVMCSCVTQQKNMLAVKQYV